MQKRDIELLLNRHGEEKIHMIILDNNRRIYVDETNIDKIEWDNENELLSIQEKDVFRIDESEIIIYCPYEYIQSISFSL